MVKGETRVHSKFHKMHFAAFFMLSHLFQTFEACKCIFVLVCCNFSSFHREGTTKTKNFKVDGCQLDLRYVKIIVFL